MEIDRLLQHVTQQANQNPEQRQRHQKTTNHPGDTPQRQPAQVKAANSPARQPEGLKKCHGIPLRQGVLTAGNRHSHCRQQNRQAATEQQETFSTLQGPGEGFAIAYAFPFMAWFQARLQPLIVIVKQVVRAGEQVHVLGTAAFLYHAGAGHIVHMNHHTGCQGREPEAAIWLPYQQAGDLKFKIAHFERFTNLQLQQSQQPGVDPDLAPPGAGGHGLASSIRTWLNFDLATQRVFVTDSLDRHQLEPTLTKDHGGEFNQLAGFQAPVTGFVNPFTRHWPAIFRLKLTVRRQKGAGRRHQGSLQLVGEQGNGGDGSHGNHQGHQHNPYITFAPVPAHRHQFFCSRHQSANSRAASGSVSTPASM